jgi:hypothetical protein
MTVITVNGLTEWGGLKIHKNFSRPLLVLLLILFRMGAVDLRGCAVVAGEARNRPRRVGPQPHIASLRALLLRGVDPRQRD